MTEKEMRDRLVKRHDKLAKEIKQVKLDAEHWNRLHPDEEPIVIDMQWPEAVLRSLRKKLKP